MATLYSLTVTLLTLPVVGASDRAVAQVSAGHEVTIKGEHAKQQFAAGYRVHIGANVGDDVFAVGREVTIEGARAHAVYTAGDTIVVKDSTLRDLFAGGHGIEIHGTI
jgi:hypothetical protein